MHISAIYLPFGLSEKLDKYDSHIVTGTIECLTETINLNRVPCPKMYENPIYRVSSEKLFPYANSVVWELLFPVEPF